MTAYRPRARTRIALVDDHALFRMGVEQAIGAEPDFEVVASGGSADEALEICRTLAPEIILVDLSMPGGGLSAVRDIARDHPEIKVGVLTVSENDADVIAALEAEVAGYILKGATAPELVGALRAMRNEERWLSPVLGLRIYNSLRGRSALEESDPFAVLSPAEHRVCRLVGTGGSNADIAAELGISERTVKYHIGRSLKKLGLKNRVEVALMAQRRTLT